MSHRNQPSAKAPTDIRRLAEERMSVGRGAVSACSKACSARSAVYNKPGSECSVAVSVCPLCGARQDNARVMVTVSSSRKYPSSLKRKRIRLLNKDGTKSWDWDHTSSRFMSTITGEPLTSPYSNPTKNPRCGGTARTERHSIKQSASKLSSQNAMMSGGRSGSRRDSGIGHDGDVGKNAFASASQRSKVLSGMEWGQRESVKGNSQVAGWDQQGSVKEASRAGWDVGGVAATAHAASRASRKSGGAPAAGDWGQMTSKPGSGRLSGFLEQPSAAQLEDWGNGSKKSSSQKRQADEWNQVLVNAASQRSGQQLETTDSRRGAEPGDGGWKSTSRKTLGEQWGTPLPAVKSASRKDGTGGFAPQRDSHSERSSRRAKEQAQQQQDGWVSLSKHDSNRDEGGNHRASRSKHDEQKTTPVSQHQQQHHHSVKSGGGGVGGVVAAWPANEPPRWLSYEVEISRSRSKPTTAAAAAPPPHSSSNINNNITPSRHSSRHHKRDTYGFARPGAISPHPLSYISPHIAPTTLPCPPSHEPAWKAHRRGSDAVRNTLWGKHGGSDKSSRYNTDLVSRDPSSVDSGSRVALQQQQQQMKKQRRRVSQRRENGGKEEEGGGGGGGGGRGRARSCAVREGYRYPTVESAGESRGR